MKPKLLFIIILVVFCGCVTQTIVAEANRSIEKVFDVPGYSKEQIFNGTKIWIAENFKSAKAVLEYENREAGTLIGNGVIPYPCHGMGCVATGHMKVPFTMRVDIKDQKFRLTFSNISLFWPPMPPAYRGGASLSGYDGPMQSQRDFDTVRPALLKFGDQLLNSFGKDKGKSNW